MEHYNAVQNEARQTMNGEYRSLDEEDNEYRKEGGRFFNRYFSFLEKYHKYVVAFWFVVMCVSFYFGPQFLDLGNDNQDAPSGTRAHTAQKMFEERFASKAKELPVLVVVSCNRKCNLEKDHKVRAFSNELYEVVRDGYNQTHGNVFGWMSYYEFEHSDYDKVKGSFMNEGKNSTYMVIVESSETLTKDRYDFMDFLKDEIDRLNPDKHLYDIGLTGFDAMAVEGVGATADEVKKIDMWTIPPAMALLGYMVRSWRLLLICFMNMGTAILGGFAFMVFLIKGCGVPRPESASAQLMEVLVLSLSIDYVLFICRRVRDETVKNHAHPKKAIYRAMLHGGHVVAMSGLTIVVVFVGFMFLPCRVVMMDGLSCSLGVSIALMVALTNTPSLILTFPHFFTTFDGLCGCCARKHKQRGRDSLLSINSIDSLQHQDNGQSLLNDQYQNLEANGNGGDSLLLSNGIDEDDDDDDDEGEETILGIQSGATEMKKRGYVHPMFRGVRFRFTRIITTWPYNLVAIITLYLCVLPLAFQVTRLEVNQDIIASLPRGAASTNTFERFLNNFPGGSFSPFYIIVTKPQNESILDEKLFSTVQDVSRDVIANTACDSSHVQSPAFLNGQAVTIGEAQKFLNYTNFCHPFKHLPPLPLCRVAYAYKFMWDQSVNEMEDSMLITMIVPFFPFAQRSKEFIDQVYDIIDKYDGQDGIHLYLSGFEVGFDAIMRHVYHLFPYMIVITLSVVFVLLGVMLKSYFVPIRLALTLVLPLAAIFGLGVLVYQDGILDWLSDATSSINGFFWYIPILIVSMQLGLALDYDCFLIVRIQEHRKDGYAVQAAIVKAVCETGGTISAAGLIMTACFGGLLLSSQSTMNASGWLLTTGVVFDTFVVTTILVPALMSIGDRIAWLPEKMPMENLVTLDAPEFTGFGVPRKPVNGHHFSNGNGHHVNLN